MVLFTRDGRHGACCVHVGLLLSVLAAVGPVAWGAAVAEDPVLLREKLHRAIRKHDLGAAKAILARSPGLVKSKPETTTPLHVAAAVGDVAIVRALVALGTDVEAVDGDVFDGVSVLSWAVACGDTPHDADANPWVCYGSVRGAKTRAQPRTKPDHAAQRRALDVARTLIEAGADAGPNPGGHYEPMCVAARYGNKALIDLLVAAGAQVEAKRPPEEGDGPLVVYGRRPIEAAAQVGNVDTLKALLAHGANPDNSEEQYLRMRPALMHAVMNGYMDVAEALLEAKADPDVTDGYDRRPLDMAALAGNKRLCDLLLRYGATNDTCTAICFGDEKRVAMRIEADSEFAKSWQGRLGGALSVAVLCHKPRIAKMLIDAGADARAPKEDRAPLAVAAIWDSVECARVLIANGADPRLLDKEERSNALYLAADNGSPGVLRLLLKHGISLAKDDSVRDPALRLAAEENRPECVKVLIENGADLKVHGLMAAVYALDREHIAPVRALLENGLDPSVADEQGRTLLHYEYVDNQIVALGLKYGMNAKAVTAQGYAPMHSLAGSSSLYYKCMSESDRRFKPFTDAAALLVRHGADTEAVAKNGWTPLLCAAARAHARFVRALHEKGASLDTRDLQGRTALHLACGEQTAAELAWECVGLEWEQAETGWGRGVVFGVEAWEEADGRLDVVRYLLRQGAPRIGVRTADGRTALHSAARAKLPEVAKLLAANGASLTLKDDAGKTPLDYADGPLRAALLAIRKKARNE